MCVCDVTAITAVCVCVRAQCPDDVKWRSGLHGVCCIAVQGPVGGPGDSSSH